MTGRSPDFDAIYGANPDPWQVGTSWYERRKLAVLLASLPRERYPTGWEPGCGPGFVTAALAGRVDDLVATDGSRVAVRLARQRCRRADIRVSELPEVPLGTPVELVVVAEFLYYVPDLDEEREMSTGGAPGPTWPTSLTAPRVIASSATKPGGAGRPHPVGSGPCAPRRWTRRARSRARCAAADQVSTSARLARTLADLTIYVRQHHLDDELERLGGHALHSHRVVGG